MEAPILGGVKRSAGASKLDPGFVSGFILYGFGFRVHGLIEALDPHPRNLLNPEPTTLVSIATPCNQHISLL